MKRKTKIHIIVYTVAILIAGALLAGVWAYIQFAEKKNRDIQEQATAKAKEETQERLPKVKIVEVLPMPFTDYLVLPGTVRPYEDIDLAAKASGSITWIGPEEGDRVEEGEKVLQVDMKAVATRVTEARARYDQALKDYNRLKKLYDEQIVSKGQLDNARTALETSKAALDSVGVNLGDGSLTSPITGILDQLNVDEGEYINPGQPVMKIVNIDQVKVELPVPEKDVLYFEKGQEVKIEFEQTNGEKIEFTGVIDFVSMTAEAAARTYLVKVLVENPDHQLRPGMIVRAHLVRRHLENAIAVPFFTIIDREDGKAVFVVDENNVARIRPIEYGVFQKGLVEVRKGLELGERLIIVGQRNLVDGEPVEVTTDITPLARQWIQEGRDISEISIDILR